MIQYNTYIYNRDNIPTKYIPAIAEYEYMLDIQYSNYHNLDTSNIVKNNIKTFNNYRNNRRYNYILAIDDSNDSVVGSMVFNQRYGGAINYFDTIAKKNIFFAYFYVNKNYRNYGIGSAMLKVLENYVRANNFPAIQLRVDCPNTKAYKLYSKRGYQPIFTEMNLLPFRTNVSPITPINYFTYDIVNKMSRSFTNKLMYFDNNLSVDHMVSNAKDTNRIGVIDNHYVVFCKHNIYKNFVNLNDILLSEESLNDNKFIVYNKIIRSFTAYVNNVGFQRICIEVPYKDTAFYKKLNFNEACYNMIKYM